MSGDYDVFETDGVPIKAWTRGVAIEDAARRQLENVARLPIVFHHVAVMPDVHFGIGATVGSVVPTEGAIIPAAVGVDIGCGMMAVQTSLAANQLPDSLRAPARADREGGAARPHRRRRPQRSRRVEQAADRRRRPRGASCRASTRRSPSSHPKLGQGNDVNHLGTLGTGNHFIEVCLDETDKVWFMLHSGSRGVGNRIGTYFIELAKKDMRRLAKDLPGQGPRVPARGHAALRRLRAGGRLGAALRDDESHADDGRAWSRAARDVLPPFELGEHRRELPPQLRRARAPLRRDVFVTRKGAVRARRRRPRHHPRLDGRAQLHRARQGQPGVVLLVQPRRGPRDVARRGEAAIHPRGSRGGDRRHRVPQGRGRDRRDADGVQADRRGDGGAGAISSRSSHELRQVVCVKG